MTLYICTEQYSKHGIRAVVEYDYVMTTKHFEDAIISCFNNRGGVIGV